MAAKPCVVGNWKSNKTVEEALHWLQEFSLLVSQHSFEISIDVILCPSYHLIHPMNEYIHRNNLPIQLASQDISAFGEGAYTGDINATQLQSYVSYVLIGHSERRKYHQESDEQLQKKVEQAQKAGLRCIYCVQDEKMNVPAGVDIVAYEPIWAIGSGTPDTPENAHTVLTSLRERTHVMRTVYGGSVTHENVASYMAKESIDGVLPGGASLKADSFYTLLKNAHV